MAVPLGSEAAEGVAGLIAALREEESRARVARTVAGGRGPHVRWVRADGVHLTLRFLGHTPDDRVQAAGDAVAAAAAGVAPFTVVLAGSGVFPRPAAPRVLWLGVAAGAEGLGRLAGRLDGPLAAAGWPPEDRPYTAHLTLARCDGAVARHEVADRLAGLAADLRLTWRADRLVLYESHPGPGGAGYEPVRVVPLVG